MAASPKVEVKEEVIPPSSTPDGQDSVTAPLVPVVANRLQLWAWRKLKFLDTRIISLARLQIAMGVVGAMDYLLRGVEVVPKLGFFSITKNVAVNNSIIVFLEYVLEAGMGIGLESLMIVNSAGLEYRNELLIWKRMTAYIAFVTCALFPILQLVFHYPSWEEVVAELSGSSLIPFLSNYAAFAFSFFQLFCIRRFLQYQLIVDGKYRVISTPTGGKTITFV